MKSRRPKFNYTYNILKILLLFSTFLSGQDKGVNIIGKVSDKETKDPIVGVNIVVYSILESDDSYVTGTSTDKNGFFETNSLRKGNYKILFNNIGYQQHIEQVKIENINAKLEINISLTPSAVLLDEVLIQNEYQEEKNISVVKVPTKLLSLLPSISGEVDVFRSLQLLPGVKVASEMSNGIYIRGGSPDQNLTLVDGAMIYNPAHLGNIASTFNTHAIYDMKLIKGAFPAEYGGRLSSVLDIKLRNGDNEREKGILGIGTINSNFVVEGPISDKFTYIISGRVMYYDQLQKIFQKESVTPRFNFHDVNIKLDYEVSPNENLSISALYSKDNIYSSPVDLGFKYKIGWSNNNIGINWIKGVSSNIITSTNISLIGYDFTSSLDDVTSLTEASDYFTSSNLQDLNIKEKVELRLTEHSKIISGLEFVLHNYTLVNWIDYNPILETSPDHSEKFNSSEISIYSQHEWDPFSFLSTNIGFRFVKYSQLNNLNVEPRLSFSLSMFSNVFLKGAYAEAHQFLHLINRNDIRLPTDLWYPSTEEISPAKSKQYVTGIDFYFLNKSYLLSLEGYYKDFNSLYEIQDLPVYSKDRKIEENFTKGKGEAYGIEFFLNKREGKFLGWIGYTFSYTKRLFINLNTGNLFPPRYDRRHDVSIVGSYSLFENMNIGFTWTYSSGPGLTMPTSQYYYKNDELEEDEKVQIYYSDRNEYKLSDYHKLDINFKFNANLFNYPVEFYVNLINVYNQKNSFTQFVAYDFDVNSNTYDYNSTLKLRQITLMPFFPTFGFSTKF